MQRRPAYGQIPEPEPRLEPEPSHKDWPPAHSPSSSKTRPEANSCTSGSTPLHIGSSSREAYNPCMLQNILGLSGSALPQNVWTPGRSASLC